MASAPPPNTPPTAARDAVISTAELRELILLWIDNKTLLLSQRVSKTWKTTIDQSIHIQRKLFFQQGPVMPLIKRQKLQHRAINPLLFHPFTNVRRGTIDTQKSILFDNKRCKGFFIIQHKAPYFRRNRGVLQMGIHFHLYPLTGTYPILLRESSGEESWRKMYMFEAGFAGDGEHFQRSQTCLMGEYLDGMKLGMAHNWESGAFRLACGIACLRDHHETYDNVKRWLKDEDCKAWDKEKGRELELQAHAEY